MKYWGVKGLSIRLPDPECRWSYVVKIEKLGDGRMKIEEGCDDYYSTTLTPADAIEALQEAIDWIKEQVEPL